MPVQFVSTMMDEEFDFAQISEINYYYDEHFSQLPDTTFSIDHYISLGYSIHYNEETESTKQIEINKISPESREFLLNYPFVTEKGDTTTISSYKAGYIVLDFWYSSCVPCLKALPEINQLAEDHADDGLVVLGINCFDKGIRTNLATKLRAKNITIPLLFGSRDLLESLRINSFPSYIIITQDRKAEFIQGYTEDMKKSIEQIFEK